MYVKHWQVSRISFPSASLVASVAVRDVYGIRCNSFIPHTDSNRIPAKSPLKLIGVKWSHDGARAHSVSGIYIEFILLSSVDSWLFESTKCKIRSGGFKQFCDSTSITTTFTLFCWHSGISPGKFANLAIYTNVLNMTLLICF